MRIRLNPEGRRRYLVVVCAGVASLHREWLEPPAERNFDLCICRIGEQREENAVECEYYYEAKGGKYAALHELITNYGDIVLQYDVVWLPDDQIRTNANVIKRMFKLFDEHKLQLAHPALTKNARFQVTVRHIDYMLRYTRFVERQAPIFSREALHICWPTFHDDATGWGLEYVWAKLLGYPLRGMAVLDTAPVQLTRSANPSELRSDLWLQLVKNADEERDVVFEEGRAVFPHHADETFHDGIRLWKPVKTTQPSNKTGGRARGAAGKTVRQPGRETAVRTAAYAGPRRKAGGVKRR